MKTTFNNSKSLEIKGKVRGTAPLIRLCHFCGEPIIKMFGQDSDSLVNHHITYIPEVKASAHRDCHAKYHATHPNHPISPETEYKKRLIEGGEDITCHFCNEPVTKLSGFVSDSLLLHSLDGDHGNWEPSNKVPTHRGCHQSFHMKGDKNPSKRPEVAAKMSKSLTGKPHPWQVGEKNYWFGKDRSGKNNPMYGKHHTEETKRKMRIAKSGPENNRKVRKKRREPYGPTEMKHGGVVKNKELNISHERCYKMVTIPPKRPYRKTGIDTDKYPSGSKEYQRRWYHINKQRKEDELEDIER